MNVFPLADLTARPDIASDATARKALTLGLAVGFLGPRWGDLPYGEELAILARGAAARARHWDATSIRATPHRKK